MKLYGAIDLHSTNSVLVVIDEEDKIVYRKRLPNDLALILQELCVYQWRLEGIVVESTYNWYWLVDGLMAEGYPVHLANTAVIQQYEGLKYSNDDSDARLAGAAAAVGNIAPGLYLPQRRAGGEGSFAQAQPVSAPENNESVKHSESDDAQHRIVGVRLGSGLAIQHSRDHEGWCVHCLECCYSVLTAPKKVRQLGSPCSLARFAGRWS